MESAASTGLLIVLFVIQSLVAFSFLYIVPTENDRYRINSLRYFRAYFLLASVGYFAYIMRAWLPFNLSVALTNFFILSSAYCVVLGLLWRYKRSTHFYYFPIVLHVCLYTMLQLILSILYPDEVLYRLILIYINLPAVFLFALSLFNRYKEQNAISDRMLKLTIIITVANILAIPIFYFSTGSENMYLSFLIMSQNLVVFVLFGAIMFSSFMDILSVYQQNATKDNVTGLNNRRSFLEQGGQLLHAAERHDFPMSMIICDIDNLQQIIEEHGYFASDIGLQAISKILIKATRREDLIARFFNQQFILLLPQTRVNGALLIAERMRLEISRTEIEYEQSKFTLTASFGVTHIDHGVDIEKCIKETDVLARQVKDAGGNQVASSSNTKSSTLHATHLTT